MKIGDLEKGVAITVIPKSKYSLLLKNCDRMEVGHSFLVTFPEEEKIYIKSLRSTLSRHGMKHDKKFVCGKVKFDQVRIWRVR